MTTKVQAPQRHSIQELKQKYESPPSANSPKSPRKSYKSTVKQLASMFNDRLKKYSPLVNAWSSEAKPAAKPHANPAAKPDAKPDAKPAAKPAANASLPKPLPLPMTSFKHPKENAPVPSPRAKTKAKIQQNIYVAEDVFAKLSVKDKAMLYSQFIGDMSKKNSKLVKHVELMEENVKRQVASGEVVNEKQESVKRLLEDLEARCAFPKQTVCPNAVQHLNYLRQRPRKPKTKITAVKSKEFEDILETKESHVSTLTVILSNNGDKRRQRRARSLPRHKTNGDHLFKELEHAHKRNNDEMRSTLPIEAYAPPKKIRRSRAEHLAPNSVFQNQQLETLFYSWLNERHQKNEENTVESSNPMPKDNEEKEKPKSAIDKLLEEAICKLETVEIKQNLKPAKLESQEYKENAISIKNVEVVKKPSKSIASKKRPAPAPPTKEISTKPSLTSESSTTSSTTTSAKHSEVEEIESGVCTYIKTTSEEAQTECQEKSDKDNTKGFEFLQPIKPLRKKKLRRSLTWKKDNSLVEPNILPTTDSESDNKTSKANNKKANNKPAPLELKPPVDADVSNDAIFEELNKTLMGEVNSPRKIKSAYTLTVFSPAPYTEDDTQDVDNSNSQKFEISQSWPTLSENQLEQDLSYVGKFVSNNLKQNIQQNNQTRSMADSLDQGFETGSNEMDSPLRPIKKTNLKRQGKSYSPLFIKLGTESRISSVETSQKLENPSHFSTPIKDQAQQNFNVNHSAVQQQLFSPISQPYKNRRRSQYESDSRRTSLAMQVIREDQPLENHEILSPRSLNNTAVFFANAPTMDITDITGINPQKTSSFWIKCGDFLVAMDIYHNDAERLRVLYEIFSQKSFDSQDLHFGIDDHKFSVHATEEEENISRRLPQSTDKSHYWFSTGDLAIPFAGKLMNSEKIERLFQFIKSSVEESGILRFGVDGTEFSNVSEFWNQLPKLSMESNYSILVGLQSGNSNGLEGRSKYAWPHSKPVPVSDLDQSDFASEDFDENDSARLSFSPFGSNYFDLASLGSEDLMMPRNGDAMKSPESFYMEFENESLDRLFEEKYTKLLNTESSISTVPIMLNAFQQQKQRLSSVRDRISDYNQPANLTSDALDALKNTPEYVTQLKSIVSDISKIGCNGGFRRCDLEQLERYMFFLSRYADICLNSCSDHMDKILDAMMDRKSVTV